MQAEIERRCAFTRDSTLQRALQRRAADGELIRPHRGLYARSVHWSSLNPTQRRLHIIRALAHRNPKRVFADIDAAVVLGLEHSWKLLENAPVHVLGQPRTYGNVRGVWAAHPDICEVHDAGAVTMSIRRSPDGEPTEPGTILATSPACTLVTCGLRMPFEFALPLFDSALRKRLVSRGELMEAIRTHRGSARNLSRLARCADPLSENGGESWLRARILEDRFVMPQLQCEFVDPVTGKRYRADFIWRLPNGDIVALEYDGVGKYVDSAMTGGRDIRRIVHDERRREAGLVSAGVKTVLRADYDEVSRWYPVRRLLLEAGIPRMDTSDVGFMQ